MDVAIEGVPEVPSATSRRVRRLATVLAVAAVLEALAFLALSAGGDPRIVLPANFITIGFIATVVLFPVMGALIVQQRPHTRVAWLMIALGLGIGFGLASYTYGVVGRPPGGPEAPFTMPALILSGLFFVPAIGGLTTWILLLFPTDRLLGRRWRYVGLLSVVATGAWVIGTIFRPGEFDSTALPGLRNPLGLEGNLGPLMGQLADAANYVGLVALILAALSLVLRYRRADPIVAAQIRWLALVAVFAVAALGASLLPLGGGLDDLVFGLGLTFAACMPIAIGIAITRYHLYDIDRLINRALVYGSLTAILAGVFTAGVGLAQRLFVAATHETSDAAVVGATLVVATLYAPLRKRLEAVVDRRFKFEQRMFGAYRDEVQRALSLLDPGPAAKRLIRTAVDELDATGGAMLGANGAITATAGAWPQPDPLRISIPNGSPTLSTIELGPRIGGAPHEQADLEELQRMATLVVQATRLGRPGGEPGR